MAITTSIELKIAVLTAVYAAAFTSSELRFYAEPQLASGAEPGAVVSRHAVSGAAITAAADTIIFGVAPQPSAETLTQVTPQSWAIVATNGTEVLLTGAVGTDITLSPATIAPAQRVEFDLDQIRIAARMT